MQEFPGVQGDSHGSSWQNCFGYIGLGLDRAMSPVLLNCCMASMMTAQHLHLNNCNTNNHIAGKDGVEPVSYL